MLVDYSRSDIDRFLALPRFAFIGVSRNPLDFSRTLFRDLLARGYDVVPVNPNTTEIEGRLCYASVKEVEGELPGALLMTPPATTSQVLEDCFAKGIRLAWLHRSGGQGSLSADALHFAAASGMKVIAGECPFMFLPNAGWAHSIHRGLRWFTGRLPA
jgi:predicted CoA-binding protein